MERRQSAGLLAAGAMLSKGLPMLDFLYKK